MRRVERIGFNECASLSAVDRASVSVTELTEVRRINGDDGTSVIDKFYFEYAALNAFDPTHGAIDNSGAFLRAGELDLIADGKSTTAIAGRKFMIPAELAARAPHATQDCIQFG